MSNTTHDTHAKGNAATTAASKAETVSKSNAPAPGGPAAPTAAPANNAQAPQQGAPAQGAQSSQAAQAGDIHQKGTAEIGVPTSALKAALDNTGLRAGDVKSHGVEAPGQKAGDAHHMSKRDAKTNYTNQTVPLSQVRDFIKRVLVEGKHLKTLDGKAHFQGSIPFAGIDSSIAYESQDQAIDAVVGLYFPHASDASEEKKVS